MSIETDILTLNMRVKELENAISNLLEMVHTLSKIDDCLGVRITQCNDRVDITRQRLRLLEVSHDLEHS